MQDCDLGTIVINAIDDLRSAAAERVIRLRDSRQPLVYFHRSLFTLILIG